MLWILHFISILLSLLINNGDTSLLVRKYTLHTRSNPNGVTTGDVLPANFDRSKETFVLINGMIATTGTSCLSGIASALLQKGDFNILQPDYSAVSPSYMAIYQQVAYAIGNFLTRNQLNPARTTLIGGSLGAQVAGMIRKRSSFPVQTIIGLDPAGPGYDSISDFSRLSTSSADYVQAIHSNMGRLGTSNMVGHDDIVINGGNNFPCCSTDFCHHVGSCSFFIDTIKRGPVGGKVCNNVIAAKMRSCGGSNVPVGFRAPKPNGRRVTQVDVTQCAAF